MNNYVLVNSMIQAFKDSPKGNKLSTSRIVNLIC